MVGRPCMFHIDNSRLRNPANSQIHHLGELHQKNVQEIGQGLDIATYDSQASPIFLKRSYIRQSPRRHPLPHTCHIDIEQHIPSPIRLHEISQPLLHRPDIAP